MKTVKLVDITVKEVPYIGYGEIRYYCMQDLVPFEDGALVTDAIQAKVVPVTRFYKDGNPDVAIAYTEELENVLGIPVRTILKENDEAKKRNDDYFDKLLNAADKIHERNIEIKRLRDIVVAYNRMSDSFFKRLKYLFTGEL